jgi:hypothetical protein
MSGLYDNSMVTYPTRLRLASLSLVATLVGCQGASSPATAPVLEQAPSAPESAQPEAPVSLFPTACETWSPDSLEWRKLADIGSQERDDDLGNTVVVSQFALPEGASPRYNAGVEICPGFLLVVNHVGETRFISLPDAAWASGPTLQPSGATSSLGVAGVESGGPVWGFRDVLMGRESLFLSDAVIDTDTECVRTEVREIPVADFLAGAADTDIVYSSVPCLDYTEEGRAAAPIKTHLAGALAYDAGTDQLFVTIGDYHLGASTIGQAANTGIAVTERDYATLRNPTAAASAVIAISTVSTTPTPRVFAKGLRNSLGLLLTPSGELWLSDHGPNGGDELNLITEGADYGWPLRAQGRPYDRSQWPLDSNRLPAPWLDFFEGDLPGATDPRFVWTPAIAPSELALYAPITPTLAHYQGTVLLGSLRGEALIALTLGGSITESRLQLGERIRDVTVVSTGVVALLSDSSQLLLISALEG